ncbi:uncharacterized protein [Triticum aestivum]|uniref:uncharacterized protein n=1 Tax=Triticum aestivum TaxID=4565 RepID=UPI001D007F34|nr:uncharacterized protein LOC123121050 [Triticum aestivum]
MALRRAIGSLVVRSQAYYLRRAAPSPPPSLSRPIIPYRPFAAPPQHAKKVTKDDDDDAGPRINNDITAPFLRLATDEGHSVVPRHETLQLAARMGLDLVEDLTHTARTCSIAVTSTIAWTAYTFCQAYSCQTYFCMLHLLPSLFVCLKKSD